MHDPRIERVQELLERAPTPRPARHPAHVEPPFPGKRIERPRPRTSTVLAGVDYELCVPTAFDQTKHRRAQLGARIHLERGHESNTCRVRRQIASSPEIGVTLLEFGIETSRKANGAGSLSADDMVNGRGLRRLRTIVQRGMLRADKGPMRTVWRAVYACATRCYVAYVRRGESGSAAFVRGTVASDEALHGLSDIDVTIVVAPDPSGPGVARARVRRRCRRVSRALPAVADLFGWPAVYEDTDLADAVAAPVLTYKLSDEPGQARDAVYSGPGFDEDKLRLAERPQLYGPMHDWRLVAGPDRRPHQAPPDADGRRIAAWLELQYWWQWAFAACARAGQPQNAYLCVKLIAEPVRIWLWLARGERVLTRAEALDKGPDLFPAEAEAFALARNLYGRLRSMPAAPLAEVLPVFLSLSAHVAHELARQVEPAGTTHVRLEWSDREALALPNGGWRPIRPTQWDEPAPALLPLVDWRALAAQSLPDETFALVDGDAGDPGTLAAAALALDRGPYPTLTAGDLQVRPVQMGGRRRLRTLQCRPTDPVSFALAAGATVAEFPNVTGFSVRNTAARAVAEHAAWLAATDGRELETLGRLITAARAALLWESLDAGDPGLPLTMEATLDALAARGAATARVAEAAREAYHEFAVFWRPPPDTVVATLRESVAALPAYGSSQVKLAR
jgi:hypothetical protein